MPKKTRNIIFIIFIYISSLFLFELIIGAGNFLKVEQDCVEKGYYTLLPYFTSYMVAGVNHFVLVSIIAIVCIFIKKVDKTYKKIIYTFPVITFMFSLPMMIPATLFARIFHLYGF